MLVTFTFGSALSIPTVNAQQSPEENGDNNTQVDIIESPDTFATDTEYDVNQISDDWVIIVINCPGVFGLC